MQEKEKLTKSLTSLNILKKKLDRGNILLIEETLLHLLCLNQALTPDVVNWKDLLEEDSSGRIFFPTLEFLVYVIFLRLLLWW